MLKPWHIIALAFTPALPPLLLFILGDMVRQWADRIEEPQW